MAESRWQDIFLKLKNAGYEIYAPAEKKGECKEPYLVLKNDGASRVGDLTTLSDIYSIMVYVPKGKYSQLEPLVQRVKSTMKELYPMIKPTGVQTPSFYDDSVKAHMISVEYSNYKRML